MSLQRFFTVAFDLAVMHEHLRPDRAYVGRIDALAWFGIVPACYREQV